MNGFKSFANKIDMDFERGVTAIVGPNGSGKSNVSDAIRWVLGEQGTRIMRSDKREDVIFNGTQKRRAKQLCEVTLVFDNQDRALPIDYSEVSVTRRLYRSGESEYLLNRSQCRLKDVIDLFRDTGIGKEGYSIIGQGRIDDILSPKSENRRQVFEEAAGIVKFRVRKKEAERKLNATMDNLQRLSDLSIELCNQLGPLEEQSAKAREYLQLRDQLKDLDLALFAYQFENNTQKLKDNIDKSNSAKDEITELDSQVEELSMELSKIKRFVEDIDENMESLQQQRIQTSQQLSKVKGDELVFSERISAAVSLRERTENEHNHGEDRKREIKNRQYELSEKTNETGNLILQMVDQLSENEAQLQRLNDEAAKKQDEIKHKSDGLMDNLTNLADVRSESARLEQEKESINKRKVELEQEIQVLEEKHKEFSQSFDKLDCDVKDIEHFIEKCDYTIIASQQEYNQIYESLKDKQIEIKQVEQSLSENIAKKKMLDDMSKDYEGFSYGVKTIMKNVENEAWINNSVHGVLGDLLSVPEGLETAISVALGSSLGNIVTHTDKDAKSLIDYLCKNKLGRATFYPVSSMKERFLNQNERQLLSMNGCLGIASELIGCDENTKVVANALLGRTVIVDTLDQGVNLARNASHTFKIVTKAGDVLSPGGAMTGGSRKEKDTSVFMRKRALKNIEKQIATLKTTKAEKAKENEAIVSRGNKLKSTLKDLREDKQIYSIQLAKDKERLRTIKDNLTANRLTYKMICDEKNRLSAQLETIVKQMQGRGSLQGDIESSQQEVKADIDNIKTELDKILARRDELGSEISSIRVKIESANQEEKQLIYEKDRLLAELDRISVVDEEKTIIIEQTQKDIEKWKQELEKARIDIERYSKMDEELVAKTVKMREDRAEIVEQVDRIGLQSKEYTARSQMLNETRHKLEVQRTKIEFENRALQERVWEDYEMTFAAAKEYEMTLGVKETTQRVNEIKKTMRDMGEINVSAVEDYRSTNERYEYINSQTNDMEKAADDLQTVILELESKMQKRFVEQFSIINSNFERTFKELFGGGSAQLILAQSNDALNSDIEIIAQPPGKKVQNISLMSGGEKALTAIAILFAMLDLKPSPFCVLDEIETALDDANVLRFARYMKNYCEKTQFIIITHRKDSMAQSDIMYGITMEEKGVSKMVSVRLSA